ncbi:vanadium-dependent haloperoxidase [Pseudoduganella sp. UC29_106]|uniref:vanadium-dependent haloperoxidase n=1 Tax=Pseudoduganella sp. UC29_106 TaxID=3374553 RepID=UPI0037568DD6
MAAAVVANRANDGRAVVLAPYVPGTAPGKFRGANPVSRFSPYIKPFTLTSASQFRSPAPPALDSAAYATDFNEVKSLGGTVSSSRTAEQLEVARFHTEPPPVFLTRNFGRFARTTDGIPEAARLMAIIYVGFSDASNACFEAKYFYEAWRPLSAIPLADTDNNAATAADATWTPVVPTPNHPEYPAAHSCTAGALGELLRQYYGTRSVTFTLNSLVTNTTRTYTSTDALADEVTMARIWGGMHFRYSTLAGAELGRASANYTMQNNFAAR